VLVASALMLGVYTIVEAGDYGWTSLHTLGLGAVSLALLAGFVARQATGTNPLLPLRVFRSRNVSGANLIMVLLVAGMFGMFFLGSLYLERVLGYDAVEIGLAFLPVSLGIGALSLLVSPRLNVRFGPRRVLIPALLPIIAGLVLFARVPVDASYVSDILPAMVLFGVGAGLAFPAMATLAMTGATASDSGLLSGLVNTTQQVGGALGLAILATLATSRTESLVDTGTSQAAALTDGYQLAFTIGAAFLVSALVLAVTVLRSESAVQEAAQESELKPAYSEAA
jgi:Na+/melibiose symporter-like transporter